MAQLMDTTVNGTLTADTLSATTIQEDGTNLNEKYNSLISIPANKISADKNVSTSSGTWTNVMSFSLEAGTYLVIISGGFVNNSSGIRYIGVDENSGSNHSQSRFNTLVFAPVNGASTQGSFPIILRPTAKKTYYINARQTSGSSLEAYAGYSAIKLA